MKKDIKLYEYEDMYDGVCRQKISIDKETVFSVYNLSECPEDAIIGRDLFDAYDFIKAVEYGMKLAQQGYTELNIIEKRDV